MITVIDYGMGNLRSVVKAIEKYTSQVQISSDPASIKDSKALIMPGDGAFGMAMKNLKSLGWIEKLKEFIHEDNYFMGICLGFQLLFSNSDEFGFHEGLNIVDGEVKRFNVGKLKVPHMGWNEVDIKPDSKFLDGIPEKSYFYFIHSFYPDKVDASWIIGETEYGTSFPCIVGKNNCIATQFHPEKSHDIGLKIIKNFVSTVC